MDTNIGINIVQQVLHIKETRQKFTKRKNIIIYFTSSLLFIVSNMINQSLPFGVVISIDHANISGMDSAPIKKAFHKRKVFCL